jgi:hypothetical protein
MDIQQGNVGHGLFGMPLQLAAGCQGYGPKSMLYEYIGGGLTLKSLILDQNELTGCWHTFPASESIPS